MHPGWVRTDMGGSSANVDRSRPPDGAAARDARRRRRDREVLAGRGRDPVVAAPEIAAYLRIRSAHSPQWLDGGARLAFLSDITGIPQIWLMPAAGGWPDQLTFEAERVSGAVASADGGAAGVRARRRRQRARPALPRRPRAGARDGRRHPLARRLLARRLVARVHPHRAQRRRLRPRRPRPRDAASAARSEPGAGTSSAT